MVWIQNPFDNLPSEGFRKQRYWMMAEAFVRAGHRVIYWTGDFSHATKRKREVKPGREGEIEVKPVPTLPYRRNVGVARIRSHHAYARAWIRLASRMPHSLWPALIITSFPPISGSEAALALGRRFGARVIVDVQDAWPETFERLAPRGFRWLARLLLAPLRAKVRRICRKADLVTGVCDRYRGWTGRSDYYRAYLGVERIERAERVRATGRVRIAYSGGLGRTYDLDTVVRAVEANADFELDVAGFGSFDCTCPRVRFHGALSAVDLMDLLGSCDIGVVPMADASFVGIPNKMFDYAAAGLSIVSSLGGESAALLERYRCGATYRPGDADSLASTVRHVMILDRGASRRLCEECFDARQIYDDYVRSVVS